MYWSRTTKALAFYAVQLICRRGGKWKLNVARLNRSKEVKSSGSINLHPAHAIFDYHRTDKKIISRGHMPSLFYADLPLPIDRLFFMRASRVYFYARAFPRIYTHIRPSTSRYNGLQAPLHIAIYQCMCAHIRPHMPISSILTANARCA